MASPSDEHFERVRFIQQEWNFSLRRCFSSKRRTYFKKIYTSVFFFIQATLQCSTSSSLEIVDALTEAAEDTPDQHLQKVRMHNSFQIMSKISIFFLSCAFALCIYYSTLSLSAGEQPRRVRALLPWPSDGRGEHVLLLGDRGRPHGGCWGYPRPTSPKSKDAQFFTNNVKN